MKKLRRPAPRSRRMVKHLTRALLARMCYRPSRRPYRIGMQTMLLRRIGGYLVANPYRPGSAEFDAFRAGQRKALLVDWESLVRQASPEQKRFTGGIHGA